MKSLTAPTKENFDFDGWYSDKELKTKYDFFRKGNKELHTLCEMDGKG